MRSSLVTHIGTGALSAIRRKRSSLSRRVSCASIWSVTSIWAPTSRSARPFAVALDLGDDVGSSASRRRSAGRCGIRRYSPRCVPASASRKCLTVALAVVGMDAVDPVFVGFVGRVRRQAVDDQIFRRAAILEAVAEIDFDAADARRCAGSAPAPLRVPAARDEPCRARSRFPADVAASVRRRRFQARRSKCPSGHAPGNLCRHFHTGRGGFASFICSCSADRQL